MQSKNFARPSEARKFDLGLLELVTLPFLSVAALAFGLSFGCGSQASTPAPNIQDSPANLSTEKQGTASATVPPEAPKGAEIGLNVDVKKIVIPNTPVSGKLHGQAFNPDNVKLDNGILTIRRGKDFFADQEVVVMLFLKGVEKPDGKTFEVGMAPEFGSPHVHMRYKEAGQNFPTSETFMDKYAMKLEFGKEADEKLPGKIYLCMPDEAKSFVAGTFVAEVATDPKLPPRPSDAPYVTGRIALKGKDKEKLRLAAGYVGQTAKGDTQSNIAGTEVVLGDIGGWASSMTFDPRVSTFGYDPKTGCMYKHVKMTPGVYLIYAQAAPAFVDWKWVEVKEKAQMTVDFSIDPADAGKLEVKLPDNSKETQISVIPLDAKGKLPDFKGSWDHIAASLNLNFDVKNGKTVIENLHAGLYRVIAGKASADAQVKAGGTEAVELREGK
jgi:hypothetical protein